MWHVPPPRTKTFDHLLVLESSVRLSLTKNCPSSGQGLSKGHWIYLTDAERYKLVFFFFKNRHVATWGGGYLTLICSLLSHPQTFLVKYTRNYNFLVGPNKQLLSSNRPHAVNELIRFSFFSFIKLRLSVRPVEKETHGKG